MSDVCSDDFVVQMGCRRVSPDRADENATDAIRHTNLSSKQSIGGKFRVNGEKSLGETPFVAILPGAVAGLDASRSIRLRIRREGPAAGRQLPVDSCTPARLVPRICHAQLDTASP